MSMLGDALRPQRAKRKPRHHAGVATSNKLIRSQTGLIEPAWIAEDRGKRGTLRRLLLLRIAAAHIAAVAIAAAAAVCVGNADNRIVVRWRGTRLEGLEDGTRALARGRTHAAARVDADQLDACRHTERHC